MLFFISLPALCFGSFAGSLFHLLLELCFAEVIVEK